MFDGHVRREHLERDIQNKRRRLLIPDLELVPAMRGINTTTLKEKNRQNKNHLLTGGAKQREKF